MASGYSGALPPRSPAGSAASAAACESGSASASSPGCAASQLRKALSLATLSAAGAEAEPASPRAALPSPSPAWAAPPPALSAEASVDAGSLWAVAVGGGGRVAVAGRKAVECWEPPVLAAPPQPHAPPPRRLSPAGAYAVALTRCSAGETLWTAGGDGCVSGVPFEGARASGAPTPPLPGAPGCAAFSLCASSDGLLAAGFADGRIVGWRVAPGEGTGDAPQQPERPSFERDAAHPDAAVVALGCCAAGRLLLSGAEDGSLVLWARDDAHASQLRCVWRDATAHAAPLTAVAVCEAAGLAVSCSWDGSLTARPLRPPPAAPASPASHAPANAAALAPPAALAASAAASAAASVAAAAASAAASAASAATSFDPPPAPPPAWTFSAPPGVGVTSLALCPRGSVLWAGLADGTLVCLRVASGEHLATLPSAHAAAVTGCAVSTDGEALVSVGLDRRVRRFTVALPAAWSRAAHARFPPPFKAAVAALLASGWLSSVDAATRGGVIDAVAARLARDAFGCLPTVAAAAAA